jgi:hypothetical protein
MRDSKERLLADQAGGSGFQDARPSDIGQRPMDRCGPRERISEVGDGSHAPQPMVAP